MSRFINFDEQFFDNNSGAPLALGKVYFGEPNAADPKTQPKSPFASDETTELTATQTLTTAGKLQQDIYLVGGYSYVVEDSGGSQVDYQPFVTGSPETLGRTFATIAEMETSTFLQVGDFISVQDYNDNGSGVMFFEIVAAGTGTADGCSYFDIPGSSAQARQIFSNGEVSIKQAGADGVGDDTTAIQAAVNTGLTVIIPENAEPYVVSSPIVVTTTQAIVGRGGIIKHADNSPVNMIELNGAGSRCWGVIIDGNDANNPIKDTHNGEIVLLKPRTRVENCTIITSSATGITNQGQQEVHIKNNAIIGCNGNGILHQDGSDAGQPDAFRAGAKDSVISGNIVNGTTGQNCYFIAGFKSDNYYAKPTDYPPRTIFANNIGIDSGDIGVEFNHVANVSSSDNIMQGMNGAGYLWRNCWFVSSDHDTAIDGNGDHFGVTTENLINTIYFSIRSTEFQWTASSSGTNEYYVEAAGGGDPGLKEPISVVISRLLVQSGVYQWTASGSGTNEFYMELNGGGDPGLANPAYVTFGLGSETTNASEGTAGSLNAGQWDYADNDGLGFSTVYVRLSDGSDPDSQADGYVTGKYNERDSAGTLNPGTWDYTDIDTLGFATIYVKLADLTNPQTQIDGFVEAQYDQDGLNISNPISIDVSEDGFAMNLSGPGILVTDVDLQRTREVKSGTGIFLQGDRVRIRGGKIDGFGRGVHINGTSNDDRKDVVVCDISYNRCWNPFRAGGTGTYRCCEFTGRIKRFRNTAVDIPNASGDSTSILDFQVIEEEIITGGTPIDFNYDQETWIGSSQFAVRGNSTETDITLTKADNGMKIFHNSASNLTVTLPEITTEWLPRNWHVELYQQNTGTITLAVEGVVPDILDGDTATAATDDKLEVTLRIKGTSGSPANTFYGHLT
jgi:hypothetical protein